MVATPLAAPAVPAVAVQAGSITVPAVLREQPIPAAAAVAATGAIPVAVGTERPVVAES